MELFIMLIIILRVTFLILNHPLSISLVLILQTIVISLITGITISTFIISYIIIIIIIRGSLVLFVYISRVASNKKFKTKLRILITYIIIIILIILNPTYFKRNTIPNLINAKEEFILIKIFNYPINIIIIFMVLFLFLTIISTSNIININKGPLRIKIYEHTYP